MTDEMKTMETTVETKEAEMPVLILEAKTCLLGGKKHV